MALAAGQSNAASSCGRACLEAFVDRYLDAVIAHDPSKAPLAPGAKFTENGQRLEFGDGLWNSMTGKGTYRLFVTDVEAGQVTFLGSIKEADMPAMIALRLRVQRPDHRGGDVDPAQRSLHARLRKDWLDLDRSHSSRRKTFSATSW